MLSRLPTVMPRTNGRTMRDLVVLVFFLVFCFLAAKRPVVGYLLWGWAGLIAINSYMFGFMTNMPFVQVFALITLASLLIYKDPLSQPFALNTTAGLLILFSIHGLVVALSAYPGLPRNWELYGNVVKTSLFCLLMPVLISTRVRLHALVIALALGASAHGVLDGLKFLASAGAHRAQSIPKFGDNNHLALVLLMVLPFLYYLFQQSARRWLRWMFLGMLLLTVLAVVSTQSRGGLIGLLVVALWIIYRGRYKVASITVLLLAVGLVVSLAPENWTSRMETIQSADQDASFMGRVAAWKVASAIAVEHPLVGGGFRALQDFAVWDRFVSSDGLLGFIDTPVLNRSGVAAHSIWFEVMGDQGFIGLFLFCALIANAFFIRRRIWVLVRSNGERQRWAGDLADMLGASMLVYVVSGSALSAAYFELPYVCIMLMEALRLQQSRQAKVQLKSKPI